MSILTRNFINVGQAGDDPELTRLLQEADQLQDAILGIVDFSTGSVAYAGSRIKDWLGCDPADLMSGGIRKVVEIVDPAQLMPVALIFAAYVQQARARDFDPRSVRYVDLAWTAITKAGPLPMLSTSVLLTYTPSRNFAWAVSLQVRETDGALETIASCKRLLRSIKERHNQLYLHPLTGAADGASPIQFANPLVDKITGRELEVLRLLARGFSTSETAASLSIAGNTVETHRKKLLEKFGARNVAELINKASKVYWLE
jgi:DNA-binding CsgD family transcriptional regulator